jgi:hypothetical protein
VSLPSGKRTEGFTFVRKVTALPDKSVGFTPLYGLWSSVSINHQHLSRKL